MMAPGIPFFPGLVQLLIMFALGSGIGVPLGVPPAKPDPMMAQVAPEKCLYYTSWAGMAKPDPQSANQTEQLLAEPEIEAFAQEVERAIRQAIQDQTARMPNPGEATAIQQIPTLVKTLLTHASALFVEDVAMGPAGINAKGALVVKLGDEQKEVQSAVEKIIAQIPVQAVRRVKLQGIECVQVELPNKVATITLGYQKDYLILAVGDKSFEGVLARSAGQPPKWLSDAMATFDIPRVSTIAYADVASIMNLIAGVAGPEPARMIDVLGLRSLSTAISVSGLDETGFVSRTKVLAKDTNTGLGALLSDKALTADDLSGIPLDASIAGALRLDLKQALDQGLELLGEVDPRASEGIRQGLQQMEQPLGMSIADDLLPALGDVWTLHAAPSGGGLLAGWTLRVSIRDQEKVGDAHDRILKMAQAVLQQQAGFDGRGVPKIREFTCADQTAYSLEIPEAEFVVTPSWCLTKTHLVVTLLPQTLKSYLTQKQDESIADQPAIKALLTQKPGPVAISYQDTRRQFETLYPILQYALSAAAKGLAQEGIDVDATALPSVTAVAPHLLPTISLARKTAEGYESETHTTIPGASLGASAPVMVALLLPAVQASREAARRMQSSNNLKQIGLAMHNYHDVYRGFPAAYSVDKDGKPLLSWRVQLLPYIEQQALYDQFHFDEPWNSPHNRKLIAQMPEVYRSPNSTAEPGKTVYLGVAGKDGVFVAPQGNQRDAGHPIGTRFQNITDGTSNTIMTVEASDQAAVIWTKPDDFEPDEENPARGLMGVRPEGFLVGFCDGSVRFISRTIDLNTLKALLSKSGGEVVQGDF